MFAPIAYGSTIAGNHSAGFPAARAAKRQRIEHGSREKRIEANFFLPVALITPTKTNNGLQENTKNGSDEGPSIEKALRLNPESRA